MTYLKQTWIDGIGGGTPISGTRLAHIEDGIQAAEIFAANRANHTGTQSADTIIDGTVNMSYTGTERIKLNGIATGATANSSDATLLNRANHTGTQSADTLTDGATVRVFLTADKNKLAGITTGATANSLDATLLSRANHTGTQAYTTITGLGSFATKSVVVVPADISATGTPSASTYLRGDGAWVSVSGVTNLTVTPAPTTVTLNSSSGTGVALGAADVVNAGLFLPTEKGKLAGIATGATANSSDAFLLSRTNHTGTQANTTITGLGSFATKSALVVPTDITATGTPSSTTYLRGDGTWSTPAGGTGSSTLATLTDTSIVTPATSDILTYNATSSLWLNTQMVDHPTILSMNNNISTNAANISALSTQSSIVDIHLIGTELSNSTNAFSDLYVGDTTVTMTNGDVLTYMGSYSLKAEAATGSTVSISLLCKIDAINGFQVTFSLPTTGVGLTYLADLMIESNQGVDALHHVQIGRLRIWNSAGTSQSAPASGVLAEYAWPITFTATDYGLTRQSVEIRFSAAVAATTTKINRLRSTLMLSRNPA